MKYRRAQHLISHPLVPSSMLWRFSDFALSDFLGKYWVLKGAQEDESAMRQLTPRSKKHLDWDSFGTTCNVIELVYQENVLLTLSENYMRSIFCIRYHHQGWLSTLKSAHTENIANCSEVWTSLKRLPFVLQNTARVHFEVVHGYSFHTERHSRKKKTNPEMQLAWMSGSQHQFFCSTNLFEWHHNTCQHRHFFHQYPVKTSAPSKTHRYGIISVSQIFSDTSLAEAKTQLSRLNWMAAAVTASSFWLFYPRRLHCILQQGYCGQYRSCDCFWYYNRRHRNKPQLMPA